MHNYSMIRVYRSPEAGEGGGIAPDAGAGDAGAQVAPEVKAPEYLSKSDFEAFQSEFRNTIQRLTPKEQAKEDAKAAPTEPDSLDPKYNKFATKEDLARYNRDNYQYHRSLDRAEEAKANEGKQSEEREKANARGHQARVNDYAKENPAFSSDMKAAAGKINVTDPVAKTIYGSKNGHLAVHYMAKNPGADQELNLLADSDGPEAVREKIGEFAAEMRAQVKQAEETSKAAGIRPPRQSFRGGASTTSRTLSEADRFERFSKG